MVKRSKKIIIEGRTPQGRQFRPSDWADRMSGVMATFKNSRIYYSPLLQPGITTEGLKCILLDPELREHSPQVFDAVLDFARHNNLLICDEDSLLTDGSS